MATLNATTSFSSFDCSFLPLRDDATVVPTSPHSSSDDADHIFPDDMMSFLGGADMALCGGTGHVGSAAAAEATPSAASAFLTSFKQEGNNNELFDLLDDIEGGSGEEDYGQFSGLLGAATPLVVDTADSRSSAPLLLFPSPRVSARTLAECPSPTPSSSSASAHQRHTFMAGASHSSSSSSSSKSHAVAATADPGRNARMAKENRERKKKYVAELESKISTLQKDKDAAQAQNVSLQADLTKAQQEIASLRAMLQNSSALAQVISALGSSGAISFGANIVSGNNKAQKRGPNDSTEDEQQEQLAGQPPQKRASTRRRGADEVAAAPPTAVSNSGAVAAPTTILPIQLNIHVHSNAL